MQIDRIIPAAPNETCPIVVMGRQCILSLLPEDIEGVSRVERKARIVMRDADTILMRVLTNVGALGLRLDREAEAALTLASSIQIGDGVHPLLPEGGLVLHVDGSTS